MKFTLARPQQPRNPFVAQARFRQAGSHRPSTAAERQRAQRELALEMRALRSQTGRAEQAPPDTHVT